MLAFHQVSAGYGDECIVSGVTFTLEAGRILGIIGPNGGGKSTLAKVLYGQADLLAGSITLDEVALGDLSAPQRARLVGVLPQSILAPFAMTAREFVRLGSVDALLGEADSTLDETVVRVMQLTNTAYLANQSITHLSGGELQRVYFAQALVNDPKLLILDEPTSHLDINHRLQMLDIVRELVKTRDKAALIIFHDFDLAARYADELIVISPRVVASADHPADRCSAQVTVPQPPREVLTPEMFRATFGVEARVDGDKIVFLERVAP
jgi:iron complex transport system ATP-binding protein